VCRCFGPAVAREATWAVQSRAAVSWVVHRPEGAVLADRNVVANAAPMRGAGGSAEVR
jgi:hypothetical protein